jgi:two-component system cell cycle sensor histidine kinase/response regulator CckA
MNRGPELTDRRARILVVDDERQNRQLLEVMLAPEGFDVVTAASGEEAIAHVADNCPDLILLDIMMPGMDGYEVARRVKGNAATRHIPIIMVTALGDRDARMRGLGAGAEDFLRKPVDRAELCVRVTNLLRLKAYGDYYGRYSEMLEAEVQARTADLADRSKQLEEQAGALLRSEERTHYALDGARMGIWELDLMTHVMSWSDTMANVFGLTPAEAPTGVTACLALIHADDRRIVGDAVAEAVRSGTDFSMEFRVLLPDGGARWIVGRARIMWDDARRPLRLLGVGADISDRKSLEAQMRQAQKMEAVGLLASSVAHDFNNLLTVIMSYSDLVLHQLPASDPRHADLLEVVGAADRAAALTRQLLAFSRKQTLRPAAIDINGLVTGMQKMLGRLIGANIELETALSSQVGAVHADHGQLEQVLMNLVVNARDAMPSGGRLAIETAEVEIDKAGGNGDAVTFGRYAKLAVRDSGTGMDEATKDRLFEPFFTTKEPGKGTCRVPTTSIMPETSRGRTEGSYGAVNSRVGSVNLTTVSTPGELSIQMRPPCPSTIPRAIARPNPAPDRLVRLDCQKRSNTNGRSSGGIPAPVSRTANTTNGPSSAASITTVRPSAVNLSALPMRFDSTCVILPGSAYTSGSSSARFRDNTIDLDIASGVSVSIAAETSSSTDVHCGARRSRPASRRVESSRS